MFKHSAFASASVLVGLSLSCVNWAQAQDRAAIKAALDTPVTTFSVPAPGKPAGEVFDTLSKTFQVPIILDKEVDGNITFRVFGSRLRGVLDAICAPQSWHYEIVGTDDFAYLAIRKFVTRTYSVDYLQVTQTSSSSSSVSLAGSSSGGSGGGGDSGGGSTGTTTTGGNNSGGGGGGGGSSSINVSSTSTQDFWARFEADAAKFVNQDEKLVINRFAGLVVLSGTTKSHAAMEAYIASLMHRVRRAARIQLQIVRVDLTNTNKMGIDWSVASFRLGNEAGPTSNPRNNPVIGGVFNPLTGSPVAGTGTSLSGISTVGSTALSAPTIQTTIASGKVSALLTALKEQGDVRIVDRAFAYALNNQPALVQISVETPTFQRQTDISLATSGTTTGTTPTTQTNYTTTVTSIGNVLELTPQIDDALITTISISPSLSELKGEITSPDGNNTALIVGTRRFRSTVTLNNGETAVLGGFIEDAQAKTVRSVPGLSSIPILGRAFRSDGTANSRSEFIILMTVFAEDARLASPVRIENPAADQTLATRDLLTREQRFTGPLSAATQAALTEAREGPPPPPVVKPKARRIDREAPAAPAPAMVVEPAPTVAVPAAPSVNLVGGDL